MIFYGPKDGNSHNPLKQVNRNTKCVCDSGKKVKKCCGVSEYVPTEWANKVQELLDGLTDDQKFSVGYKK